MEDYIKVEKIGEGENLATPGPGAGFNMSHRVARPTTSTVFHGNKRQCCATKSVNADEEKANIHSLFSHDC